MRIFTGRANPALAKGISDYLRQPLGNLTITNFPDGEIFCKINENVRGTDAFLIQSTCQPVNESVMELLILLECFRRASARRITCVIPYFGYARQDRKDDGRVPITAKLIADLLTKAGADRIVSMDLHAAQIEGFFSIPVDHLNAGIVLDKYFKSLNILEDELVIVSPDAGSAKRSLKHQHVLGGGLAIVDKRRSSATDTVQANITGNSVEGKTCILFDDMISTAGSICGAAKMVKDAGASKVYIAATHAVFCGPAVEKLNACPVEEIVVTDTIPLTPERTPEKVRVLSVAPLLGEAIRRLHFNESISCLFKDPE
ncbi:MAG: ribose-phosphate pyrophosphokinase [Thermoguttaceae bacterium]|nr:ribose-phosphate pyrophosphokinase [Thermoguttaceae bacterium]